jgi:4-amino-4-deoxy-L-arabinose transferase-like glycosyltransferase
MLDLFKKSSLIFYILLLSLFLRLINFSYPSFTSEEARISYRGFTLSHFGKDELGRIYPLVLNSLSDYQLPVTSYLSAISIFIFGKSEFAARIPFILIGILIVFLGYKIAKIINQNRFFSISNALIISSSPVLIFLSKVPNETIVLIFLIQLTFYLQLANRKVYWILISLILSLLVSKIAWLVMPPFVVFNQFRLSTILRKEIKVKRSIFYFLMTSCIVFYFLKIPQFPRSLMENNFPLFLNTSITPALNQMRGQGLESGWSPLLEKFIFNKIHYVTIAFLHWLSSFSLGIYFGQFDKLGLFNYTQLGAFAKILVIPFVFGFINLIRKDNKDRFILFYLVIFTYPAIFNYPNIDLKLLACLIPFISLIICYGVINLKKYFLILIALGIAIEVLTGISYINPDMKNTNHLRPEWIQDITLDIYRSSTLQKVAVSDDIIKDDIVPFIEWYQYKNSPTNLPNINYPYKFRQFELDNIKIIGSDVKIPVCKYKDYSQIFLSSRDIKRMNELHTKISKIYTDNLNTDSVFVVERTLCTP